MIIIENENFALKLSDTCVVESLLNKRNGEECILKDVCLPLFSVTQDRPFNNEIKLAYMNKRTTFQANSASFDGARLTVGFELVPYKAYVDVKIREKYITFTLSSFEVSKEDYPNAMDTPPLTEFNLCQLAVSRNNAWGQWLNVAHTESSKICIMATSPYELCDSECIGNIRVMRSRALKDLKTCGCSAALIVSSPDEFLDAVEAVEVDYNLPKGVESRRSDLINASIMWTSGITPKNVDEYIAYCKKCAFRLMLIYYPTFFKVDCFYNTYGDLDYNDNYPRGLEDVRFVIEKIKSAGIKVGFHFLHTHIGLNSRYATPRADHRLNLKKHFTLARELNAGECDTVYVCEKPTGAPIMKGDMVGKGYKLPDTADEYTCQILRFGGELISYSGYSEEYPYCFTGCKRGYHGTDITKHKVGEIGGVLDVSEYGATSVYVNQDTDLADEYAEKLREVYDLGFEFIYFDGSEGTNLPYEYHIPNAQYKVYKKLKSAPIFCEGAAKAHFNWHMLSGANAFDVFPNEIFKKMIIEHPFREAEIMKYDYTRVNFGWWRFNAKTSPDLFEFGTSKAAACDCPMTILFSLPLVKSNPRADDVMEVVRRWEQARKTGWITKEIKQKLSATDKEFTLLIDERGEMELAECTGVSVGDSKRISAYVFERKGGVYASVWDNEGSSVLKIKKDVISSYFVDFSKDEIEYKTDEEFAFLTVCSKAYIKVSCDVQTLRALLDKAEILQE